MKSTKRLQRELAKVKLPGLEWNRETKTHDDTVQAPLVFERDGYLRLSAENGDGAADYYGEFRGEYPYINPDIEAAAKRCGFYLEWENAGCLTFYEI